MLCQKSETKKIIINFNRNVDFVPSVVSTSDHLSVDASVKKKKVDIDIF